MRLGSGTVLPAIYGARVMSFENSISSLDSVKHQRVLPAYTDNAKLRLVIGTLLYLAQGLSQGVLFIAIPSWLAANGQPAAGIGSVIAAMSLPWSIKFITGSVVDRYAFLPMGRRRGWIMGAQLSILATLIFFALMNPAPEMLVFIIVFVSILSFFTSVQDVALDAMIIDLTPTSELGKINAYMLTGKSVGLAGGGAVTSYFLEFQGFTIAMFVLAGLFAIPALVATLFRERPGERLFPWTSGVASPESIHLKPQAWWSVLKETLAVLFRRDPLFIIALCIFYGMHQGIFEATMPVFATQEMGWGETRYASLSGVGYLVSGGLGIVIGGWATDKIGPSIFARLSAILGGLLLALLIVFRPTPDDGMIFSTWYLSLAVMVFFFYLCMVTIGMRVCKAKVAATSYALIMGSMALGMMFGALMVGPLEQFGSYSAMFGGAIITLLISAAMVLGLSAETGGPKRGYSYAKPC